MDDTVRDDVTGWETRSVADGYRGLRSLADGGWSGAVEAGRTWAFLVNGRVVGVVDGRIEAFDGAPLSAHEAPVPELALLYAMRATADGEARARYFTDDKPIAEADAELSEGGFTGYVELSENVLSGDYYVVYQGGRSTALAFVGSSRRLLSGDEAFERADDEVGIYGVHPVDLEVVEIPARGGTDDAAGEVSDDAPAVDGEPTPASGADGDGDGDPDPGRAGAPGLDAGSGAGSDPDPSTAGADVDAGLDADASAGADPSPADADDPAFEDGVGLELGADEPSTSDDSPTIDLERSLTGEAPPEAADPSGPADDGGDGAPDVGAGVDGDAGATREEPDASDAGGEAVPDGERRDDPPTAADDGGTRDRAGGTSADAAAPSDPAAERGATTDATSDPSATGPASGDAAAADPGSTRTDEPVRSIPALDPEASTTPDGDERPATGTENAAAAAVESDPSADDRGGTAPSDGTDADPDADPDPDVAPSAAGSGVGVGANGEAGGVAPARVEDLEDALAAAEEGREAAEARVAELEAELSAAREERESVAEEYEAAVRERDSLADERDRYRQRAEELRERVEELEAELSSTREELDRTSTQLQEAREELAAAREAGEAPPSGRSVSPTEALSGAHVLVRYDQASGPTLAKARDGEVGRPEVNDNLRLEYHHTRFDADDAVVDGRTFDEFLVDTTQYRFVRWVVEELMYEIVETGNREGLDRLYDAIPESNRAEFEGGVTVPVDDGGGHESLSFDVVIRDRMGNPLVVADLNAGRDAATESQMVDLVEKGRKVAAAKEPFAGAFLVTASFFDPAALETADDATESGGLLGGGSRRSYVKLSRKTGFHLCLVETRDGAFHVNVPEL